LPEEIILYAISAISPGQATAEMIVIVSCMIMADNSQKVLSNTVGRFSILWG